ncbi:MAG TPA: ABC transporter ATP-binding protein [Rhabdochlamydiaceae bacterium]|jgi:ABC-type multidrug transport system fused ATPase/permease subunit|nr:ABC transporter ATP-binding protein [Rhabdochlamydiaceae bacterium]
MFGQIRHPKLFSVDFTRPWWRLLFKQKTVFFLILLVTACFQVFLTLLPMLAAKIFEAGSFQVCLGIFLVWLILSLVYHVVRRFIAKFQLQCIYSVQQSAHLHLLTVDPRYHVHRSSGAILAKIQRAAHGVEDLLDYITDDFTTLFVGLITILIVMIQYSWWVAGALAVFIAAIFVGGYYFAKIYSRPWEERFIQTDDVFKTTAAENLSQVQLIRSSFASNERTEQLKENILTNIKTEGSLWLFYTSSFFLLEILYLTSLFILAMALVWQIRHQMLTAPLAVGIFLSYMQGTKSLVSAVRLFRKTMRSIASIRDLFAFIPTFGKETIPVLGTAETIAQRTEITLKVEGLFFDYGISPIFHNHSLHLNAMKATSSKLYGIIGPSGSGKSTLLAIIGGQLKPLSGTVMVDGVDIYQANDAKRRQLIALQGQISTHIRGTVRSNLLLGLPQVAVCSDEELLKVLEDVGLLPILHEGQETKIGEGGLNLSGGQRQRLNFAALFLRAKYYKPDLILVDEPTSSLDEISETKITTLLVELSQQSLTLVIAHRLRTVEQAAGLIDLSLLSKTSEIKAYSSADLMKISEYYRLLMQGKVALDA